MQNQKYRILIIGAGNLGLATGLTLMKLGFSVCFYDVNFNQTLKLQQMGFKVTDLKEDLTSLLYTYICVPTPSIKNKMSTKYLKKSLETLTSLIKSNKIQITIIIRSTILPGTIDKFVLPFLRKNLAGFSFGLCYQPSFMRERSGLLDEQKPWLTIYACDSSNTEHNMKIIWKNIPGKYFRLKFAEAELIKYGSNTYNALKISFYNQLAIIGNNLKLDGPKISKLVSKAAEGNWNPQYGTKAGKPFNGSCLPKDLKAFITFLKSTKLEDHGLFQVIEDINNHNHCK